MRRRLAGGVAALMLLLGACGDPGAESEGPPPAEPGAADKPSQTTRQRANEPPARQQKHGKSAPRPKPTVLYLGDSLAMENQVVLGGLLRDRLGARYTSAPYSGTTLCDYLEGTGEDSLVPDKDKAAALVRSTRPDFVVLQFWGNAWGYTPCMDGITYDKARERYFARYEADARRLAGQIGDAARDAGARPPKVVWVLQGPDPITPDRVRQVNDIYRRRGAAHAELLADAGRAVSPATARYTWVRELPCTAYERAHPSYCTEPGGRTALHLKDDYLHFCLAPTTSKPKPCQVRSPGIRRIGQAVTDAVARAATAD
ncbi:SGNH/GDSL hydrolase family protein [Streptomyces sp. NPDC059063]|uniref:SGNH/GDSL hydrolase family protein n=1 Tax=unclassified Streptomyces TaxID=2593676 RepID=UPI0036B37F22